MRAIVHQVEILTPSIQRLKFTATAWRTTHKFHCKEHYKSSKKIIIFSLPRSTVQSSRLSQSRAHSDQFPQIFFWNKIKIQSFLSMGEKVMAMVKNGACGKQKVERSLLHRRENVVQSSGDWKMNERNEKKHLACTWRINRLAFLLWQRGTIFGPKSWKCLTIIYN